MDKTQLREMIDTVLVYLDPAIKYSRTARELLMLTAATESHLGTYWRQIKGPARGIFQMEPDTEYDIWDNFLRYKHTLHSLVKELLGTPNFTFPASQWNLAYQIAMARVHYFRVKAPLTLMGVNGNWSHKEIFSLAEYWKDHYNTKLGKGTPKKACDDYMRLCVT